MAEQILSPRERRILAELEHELRRETALDLALRTMLPPRPGPVDRLLQRCARIQLDWLILLIACGLALGTMALEVRTVALAVSTAGLWAVTALLAAARARGRRRRGRDAH